MAQHLAGQGELPSLLDVPGMEPAQVGSFYAAAAEFYRRKPWQRVPGDTPIKVECDKFQSGPWYAVVMGQSGVQQGVAVYEDLAALQGMITGGRSEEENSRGMSALSLMFSEAFEIPVRDLDAAERHGWPVAGPEAYPLVIRINPGLAVRPPLAWELEASGGLPAGDPRVPRGEEGRVGEDGRRGVREADRAAFMGGGRISNFQLRCQWLFVEAAGIEPDNDLYRPRRGLPPDGSRLILLLPRMEHG